MRCVQPSNGGERGGGGGGTGVGAQAMDGVEGGAAADTDGDRTGAKRPGTFASHTATVGAYVVG